MKPSRLKFVSFGLMFALMTAWMACSEDEEPGMDEETAEVTGNYDVVSISGAPLESLIAQQAEARGADVNATVTPDIDTANTFTMSLHVDVFEIQTEQGVVPFPEGTFLQYDIKGTYVSDATTITFSSGPGEWTLSPEVEAFAENLGAIGFEDMSTFDIIGQFTGTWVASGENVTLDSGTGLGYFLVRRAE